jgi:predicted small secreted protein
MARLLFILVLTSALSSCGTTRGVVQGVGNLFQGVADDFHSASGWLGG